MNEEVSSLYATIGVKISGAISGLRDFRSRLQQAQSGLKTLRDQSKITSTAVTAGLAAGLVALGVKAATAMGDASASMAVFQLVTKATTGEMEAARAKIAELARDASLPAATIPASSAALSELGKAGLSARDAIDALRPTMLLAAAGEIEAKDAAQILANTLNAFKLPGTEAARIADLLAGAEVAAAGSIRDHAQALSQASAVWALAKQPVESLVTSIGLLANAGIIGSDAGTSLRTMMLRLISPTDEAKGLMTAMGVSIYDSAGKMRDWRVIVDQFQKGLAPLTDAQKNQRLETIFGTDAIRAAAVIFGGGTKAYDEMMAAVTRTGLAQELANAKTSGLTGATENLSKAVSTASIDALKPFEDDLIVIAHAVAGAILAFDALDPTVKNVILGVLGAIVVLAALTGGVALVSGAITGVIAAVTTVIGWVAGLAVGAEALGGVLALLVSGPIGWVILMLAFLAAGLVIAYNTSETFRNIVDGAFGAVEGAARGMWGVVGPVIRDFVDLIQRAIDKLNQLAGTHVTIPSIAAGIPGVGGVVGAIGAIGGIWQGANPTRVVNVGGGVGSDRNQAMALGGNVSGGSSYLVGEQGPEMFTPGRSGSITANGAGGATINNNFYGPVFGFSDVKDMIVKAIAEAKAEGRV